MCFCISGLDDEVVGLFCGVVCMVLVVCGEVCGVGVICVKVVDVVNVVVMVRVVFRCSLIMVELFFL